MNDSTSTISPAWPTHWPKDSFRSPWAWVLAILLVIGIVWAFVAGINTNAKALPQVPPLFLLIGILVQAFAEMIIVGVVLLALPALSKFSLRDIGFRVPSGATMPCQPPAAKPGKVSATVGRSGKSGSRCVEATASAVIVCAWIAPARPE